MGTTLKYNMTVFKMTNKNLHSGNVELRPIDPTRHDERGHWYEYALFIDGAKVGEYRENCLQAAYDFYNMIEQETWNNNDWSEPLAINP